MNDIYFSFFWEFFQCLVVFFVTLYEFTGCPCINQRERGILVLHILKLK